MFEARLERTRSRLNWVVVHIPFNVAEVWGSRGQLKVRGDINGYVFRTSLFPTGNNGHILLVNKRMQAGAKTGIGKVARFRLEPDTDTRDILVPEELMEELSADRRLVRDREAFFVLGDGAHRDFLCHNNSGCVTMRTASVDSVPRAPITSIPTTMSG